MAKDNIQNNLLLQSDNNISGHFLLDWGFGQI